MTTTTDAQRLIAVNMSEEALLKNILDAARKLGWRSAHFRPAKTEQGWRTPVSGDGKGFLDLVLLHERMHLVVVAECKTMKGELTKEQEGWLYSWRCAGVPALVWRPDAWLDGTIQRVLEGHL